MRYIEILKCRGQQIVFSLEIRKSRKIYTEIPEIHPKILRWVFSSSGCNRL
jgi:hypothetical protein